MPYPEIMKHISSLLLIITLVYSCKKVSYSKTINSDKIIYDVVFRDNLAGTYEKQQVGENSFKFYYTYTDRGRGPKVLEEITLNEQNFITAQSITGHNYLKDSINEFYYNQGTKATWVNPKGKNRGDVNENSLYFRYDGSPAIYEVLAKLLLSSEDKKINYTRRETLSS